MVRQKTALVRRAFWSLFSSRASVYISARFSSLSYGTRVDPNGISECILESSPWRDARTERCRRGRHRSLCNIINTVQETSFRRSRRTCVYIVSPSRSIPFLRDLCLIETSQKNAKRTKSLHYIRIFLSQERTAECTQHFSSDTSISSYETSLSNISKQFSGSKRKKQDFCINNIAYLLNMLNAMGVTGDWWFS